MARYPKQKVSAFGVYHEFTIMGKKMRSLESVHFNLSEADNVISKQFKPNEYYVEEVEVTMKAWTTN